MIYMKRKILIVEDNQSVRENIAEILEIENYETHQAENGAIAFDIARKIQPDLVICDIMMPEVDGYEVLRLMRQTPITSTVPFIFLTAKTSKEDIRKGMELGADDFITKPFTIEELLKAVTARLQKFDTQKKVFEEKGENLAQNIGNPIRNQINEPLKAIISFSEMILAEYESMDKFQIAEFVSLIYKNGMKLSKLVKKTMLYYQLESLAVNENSINILRLQTTSDIKSIIENTAKQIAQYTNRAEDLVLNLEDARIMIPCNFFTDLITELLENAFNYSPKRTRVKIISGIEKNTIVISIIDEGVGLSEDQIQKIGAFVQFGKDISNQTGIGIGLHNAKKILQLFNGTFSINSKQGLGTMIKISLPIS